MRLREGPAVAEWGVIVARTFKKAVRILGLVSVGALGASAPWAAYADPANGADIAQKGLPKVAPCSRCHGANGEGIESVGPRLAGLSKAYLVGQLSEFRSGARKNPVMDLVAVDLTPAQSEDVADYYSAVVASSHPVSSDASLLKAGQQIAEQGNASAGVPACNTCHGPAGIGVAPNFPYLAGRQVGYMVRQIQAWKTDQRGDPLGLMKPVAVKLSDDDALSVATYYASLTAPKSQGAK